jgi:hypothetical protein
VELHKMISQLHAWLLRRWKGYRSGQVATALSFELLNWMTAKENGDQKAAARWLARKYAALADDGDGPDGRHLRVVK